MREAIGTPHLSKITLAARPECTQSLTASNLHRVREPVSRSKTGVQGKVADSLHGRSRHAESQNELLAFRVLMATGHPDAWQEQPFCLAYQHEGELHRYTPDILVCWDRYQEVVEIKPDSDAESPDNQARFALVTELLAEHGFHFRVWKQSEICAQPRLANVGLILRYRLFPVAPAKREEIRRVFSAAPQLPLGSLAKQPMMIQSALRLVLEGTLYIDWWQTLSLGSAISRSPIGRQEWPASHVSMEVPTCLCTH